MLLGEAKFLWAFSLSSPQKVIHIFVMMLGTNGIPAINASEWNIEMGSDGVHFSIEGHKRFAECFIKSRYWRENRID